MNRLPRLLAVLLVALLPLSALAQGAGIAFNTSGFDSGQPVEISADALSVDQTTGEATFDGNVLVVQGTVRMSAGRVIVVYATNAGATNGISELRADGGVTFVTATEAAESANAVYSIATNTVTMLGGVLLTQGPNALSGEKLTLDLTSGQGRMEGRVRTVIGAGGGN